MRIKGPSKLKFIIIYCFVFILIFIGLIIEKKLNTKTTIIIDEKGPGILKDILASKFPNHQVTSGEDSHLLYFTGGVDKVITYDIEAQGLLDGGGKYYFYPLYKDLITIALNRDIVKEKVESWEDLRNLDYEISIPGDSNELRYIWANLSKIYSGRIDHKGAIEYLKSLNNNERIQWNQEESPIIIDFTQRIYARNLENSIDIVIPQEGSLTCQIGILSHSPIESSLIDEIRRDLETQMDLSLEKQTADNPKIIDSLDYKEEIRSMELLTASLKRDIMGVRKYAPVNSQEHHLLSLAYVILILILSEYSQVRVIHKGIREGLLLIEHLLMGWVFLGIFKYALHGYSIYSHYSWYLFYLFYLPIPAIIFYISKNVDHAEERNITKGAKTNFALSIFFIILVLTNDLHQLIFNFNSSDYEIMSSNYGYGWGFVLLNIWFILISLFAILIMFKKGIDSPKKKMVILPGLALLIGITYSLAYNFRIPLAYEFPMVLGLVGIIVLFIVSAIYSGLIPNNKNYYNVFKNSRLDMKIYNYKGKLIYASRGLQDLNESSNLEKENFQWDKGNFLYKSSAIKGGYVTTKDDISDLISLRKELNKNIETLKRENKILSEKEKIEGRLYLVNEQNKLAREIYEEIKDKLYDIENMIRQLRDQDRNNTIGKIELKALYCKRRSELLVKSKSNGKFPARELCRIIKEMSKLIANRVYTLCTMDSTIDLSHAIRLYSYYYKIIELAEESNIDFLTIRISNKDGYYSMKLIVDGDSKDFQENFGQIFIEDKNLECLIKEIDGSLAINLKFQGGDSLVGAL